MKIIQILLLVVLANVCSIAQTAKLTQPSDVTTVRKSSFPREKFDPARNAKADLELAIAKATASGRRIILDIGGEWCGWCVYMDKFFLEHPPLTKLRDDNFVWLKVNMSPENENKEFLSAYPEATSYPHLYVLDEKGVLLHSQRTEPLEAGKGYNLVVFTDFLQKWAPVRTPAK